MENYNNYQNGGYYNGQMNGNGYNVQPKEPIWAAVVGFVLSLVNIVTCCCCTYLFAPLSIIFCIISLVKKWRGTGLAVSGIVISTVTVILMVVSNVFFGQMSRDFSTLISEAPRYAEEYNKTGEIPEEYIKYNDEKYDYYWKMCGCEDFEEFYDRLMSYLYPKSSYQNGSEHEDKLDDSDFFNDRYTDDYGDTDYDFGEKLVDI